MELRWYQRAAIDALYDYFTRATGDPLLVLPTGSGKSVIQAAFQQEVMARWPNQRILLLSHVKELLEQNAEKLLAFWPDAPLGIYSAGMGQRVSSMPLTIASIQSVHKRPALIGRQDLIIIDEAHLIAPRAESMYRAFLAAMRRLNPAVKVIGMTATPYRLDSGYLHQGEGALFTDIAYELPITDLIREGYLCTLASKGAARKIDLTDVHIRGGEYAADDLNRAVHQDGFTEAAVDEVCHYGAARDSWLLFTPSVEYAGEVCELLTARMVRAAVLSGETPKDERARIIADFRARRIRALVNCNVLTTGFDAPAVDLVVLLRSTKSTALYVQMVGRGMRTSPGKTDCLVLDFGGNIERHGPIDDLRVSTRRGSKGDGVALPPPAKECPDCRTIVSVFARACPECEHAWVLGEKAPHEAAASDAAILTADIEPEWMEVQSAWYLRHEKLDRPTSLRVEYNCGLRMICEWVCIEHKGYARAQAEKWFAARGMATPASVDEAIALESLIPVPTRVLVRRDGKFDRVINYEFGARDERAGTSAHLDDDHDDDDIFGSLEGTRAA